MARRRRHRHRAHQQQPQRRELCRVPLPPVHIDPACCWYAVRTAYGRDRQTERDLAEIGIATYRPIMAFEHCRHGRRIAIERNAAPGWLFAGDRKADDAEKFVLAIRLASKAKTHHEPFIGVCGPIASEAIQLFADNVTCSDPAPIPPLSIGQKSIIADGPFAGFEALVEQIIGNRILANVYMLGRQIRMKLLIDNLQIVA